MIKKSLSYLKEYKQFTIALVASVVAFPLDLFGQRQVAHIILAVGAIGLSLPLAWNMVQDIRAGKYGVDILAATAIITSVILGEYWAGMIIVLMLTGGESLEDYAQTRARKELDALLSGSPKRAHLLRGRKIIEVKASALKTADKIVIRAGELVPADAIIIEGSASFDESSLTGEAVPASKKSGDELLSGSLNMDGAITAKVLRTAKDSQYEQIVQLVKAAASSKSPFIRLADRYSIPFTVVAFSIAITAWVLSGESIRFLQVLVVATPCPLILAAPIAVISGMSQAAKRGIIIKSGSALERLAEVKTLAFDKTGTLTKGQLSVDEIKAYGKFDKTEVLKLAAAVEQHSNHLLAKAIVERAQKGKVKTPKASNVREFAGSGLSATVQGKEVLVGRIGLLKEQKFIKPKRFKQQNFKQTASLVAVDEHLVGIISFKDELRPEAKSTIQRLKKLGIKNILMVTGDNKASALTIAKRLGITEVEADALPRDKMTVIESVLGRPVGFVGDGVNDAPVLAASDVGIALGARGSAAASESADVVIMLDDLSRVAAGVEVAKKTFYIAKQSILIGIFISVGLMFIFSTGKFKPVYGAAIQEVVDIIVIFNALRVHGLKLANDPKRT